MTVRKVSILRSSGILNKTKVRELDELYLRPERRTCERYPSNLQARLFYGNLIYSGMVTNLSGSGMFVSTKVNFPVHSEFMIVILLKNRTVEIPIKVRRMVKHKSDDESGVESGIGVELIDAPQNYLTYVGTHETPRQFRNNSFFHSQE